MPDTGVPSDLTPLKEPLIESVINAYMAKQVPESGPFEYDEGTCETHEFRFKQSRFGMDTKVYCSYPGGDWKVDQFLDPDDDRAPGDHIGEDLVLFDAAAKFAEIRENVSAWIDPWINCPDPNDLTSQMTNLAYVVDQLYVQSEVRVGGETIPGGDDSEGSTSVPVSDVRSAIVDMGSDLSSLNGLAIDALERSYVNDVGLTISGQRALAAVAALAVGGEAEAWSRAFGDLVSFFTQATADFNSYAASHGASGGGAETTLSVLSGTAGAASAATFAFPPASVTLGVISGLAGIGGAFWPSEEAVPARIVALSGGSFGEMWQSFGESVLDVNGELVQAEYALAIMCRNVLDDYRSNPDSFSITAKGPNGTPQAGDNLPRFLDTDQDSAPIELYAGDDIRVVHSKLRSVAGMIEHVGDHQRTVAGRLGSAPSGDWSRQNLQGTIIGWGPTGHQGDVSSVVDGLVDLLLLESRTAHRIAEQCVNISTGFSRTEDQIETELNRLEQRLGR